MANLLTNPPRLPMVSASILSADFARIGEECQTVLDEGADMLHLDVMDGHFVPNLTMGQDMCKAVRRVVPEAFLDVHFMVTEPVQYVDSFIKAGANHLTFHVEAVGGQAAVDLARAIEAQGATAGLAINPGTDAGEVLSIVEHFAMVLVMSINPGYSGQSFMPEVLEKVTQISDRLRPDQRLEMDGGVAAETASQCIAAGCDLLASASAIFGVPPGRRGEVIERLRGKPGSENVSGSGRAAQNA